MSSKIVSSYSSVALIALFGGGLMLNTSLVYPQSADVGVSTNVTNKSSSGASNMGSSSSTARLNKADEKLVVQLAQANITEINTAKLAEEKSKNDQVKTLAKKMMDDHSKALDELKLLAQSKSVTLPTEPDRQQKLVENRLMALSGEKFDKQYVEQIAERARKGEHKLLLQVGAKAQDMELKNYATKTLAVIESQQQLVKDTSRSIESGSHGKSDSGASGGGGMGEKSRPAYGQ
jgi:putative membrane protein